MRTVAAVAMNGISEFELGVACEVFGLDRSDLGVPWYRFFVCAVDPPPIRTCAGLSLTTSATLNDLSRADTVIVTDWPDPREDVPDHLVDAIRRAYRRGTRLVSFCTGTFVLAAAGVLDRRPATTHWLWADELAARYPNIFVDPSVLYVDDGQVLTAAGTASSLDLSLYLVRHDYGAQIANAVSRRMVVAPHRAGGQAQFVDRPIRSEPVSRDLLPSVFEWTLQNLGNPLTIKDLASRAAMSPRTFLRRFRAATGETPYQWLLQQRILLAQRLLEETDQPVERVAELCGFGSAASLRVHFQRSVGVPPLTYRRTFRASHADAKDIVRILA